jgi:hypothetical protein
MIVDLDSWEAGYGDGLRGRPISARPVSTGSRIRAATSRLAHIVRARGKAFGCAPLARRPNGSLEDTVAALG